MYLFPLSTEDLDRAVELRKEALRAKEEKSVASKRSVSSENKLDMSYIETQAETSYLLLSHNQGSSGAVSGDHEFQRTGRWTDDEIAYIDFLVEAFDNGRITVEHGLKLNEFLSEILLCKSSRLTKKMKNARLSVRSYKFASPVPRLDVEMLKSLEQKFLESVSSEASRLELKFNSSRLWRSHLSNLCLQIGSSMLDANDWIVSLEDMERRASDAEERLRKARRRRMGLALRTDCRNDQEGVHFGGVPVQRPPKKMSAFIANILGIGAYQVNDAPGDDYSKIRDELVLGGRTLMPKLVRKNCGPFLEELASYMERNSLPFHHVDVWVPSYSKVGCDDPPSPRLFHAGYATCHHNIDSSLVSKLDKYGEYSTRFSFPSEVGLPGRVFATGKHVWERRIDEADPKFFERAGGAKVYGVKTGFGFPLTTNVIGSIVVAMYSVNDMVENGSLVVKTISDLSQLSPEPKWRLVVEMGDTKDYPGTGAKVYLPNPSESNIPYSSAKSVAQGHRHGGLQSIDDTEQLIASVLGEYMPLSDVPAEGEPTYAPSAPNSMVPHVMSLRLLLLRSPDRRSDVEREMVEVIKKSYEGYMADSRRGKRDVALLLIRDWLFLKSSLEGDSRKQPARPIEQQQLQVNHAAASQPAEMLNAFPMASLSSTLRGPSEQLIAGSRESNDSSSSSIIGSDVNIVENMS